MKNHIFASMLTMIVSRLNTMIDGIFLGKLISPNAMSAVNIFSPIGMLMGALTALFVYGGTILLARYTGERNREKQIKTVSAIVISIIFLSIFFVIVAIFFTPTLSQLLCNNSDIRYHLERYMFISIAAGGLSMIYILLSSFVRINGNPKYILKIACVLVSVNILLDYYLIAIMNLGAAASAFASVIAVIVGIVLIFNKSRKEFSYLLSNPFKNYSLLYGKNNLRQGVPLVVNCILFAALVAILNTVILKKQGADGMFAMSIVVQLLSLSSMFAIGLGSSITSMGAVFLGQNDTIGFNTIAKRCILMVICAIIALQVFIYIYPSSLSNLFGADRKDLLDYTNSVLRITSWILLPMQLSIYFMNQFYVQGFLKLPIILSISSVATMAPALFIWGNIDPFAVWYAFPTTGGCIFVILFIITEITRRKKGNLSFLTLLTKEVPENTFDCSVEIANKASLNNTINNLAEWFHELSIDEQLKNKVNVCLEELILNVIENTPKKDKKEFVDIHVTIKNNRLLASVKDAGTPFNPTICPEDNLGIGLRIVKTLCPQFEYKYMYGQNVTFLTWEM